MKTDPLGWLLSTLGSDLHAPNYHAGQGDAMAPPRARREAADVLQAGDRVEQFRVKRLLGKGGMGEVYLARDTVLGRRVAIKIISPSGLPGQDAVERFLFEARAVARFSHPNIVTIYSASAHEGRPYVTMEYLEGQNLRARLREDPPGQRESMRIMLAVAEALTEAHARGIVHRDLKPENLLIPRDGQVRVVDFGLATVMASPIPEEAGGQGGAEETLDSISSEDIDPAELRAVRGSPPYMAPEQWLRQEATGATDIWALGVTLHELLVGERPHERRSFFELASLVMSQDELELPLDSGQPGTPALPPELGELIRRCLTKAPGQRPDAAEVARQLRRQLQRGGSLASDLSRSPFRGLMPFAERHAELFFGRDAEILEFMEQFRERAVLPVVGPSGAGKSSFVQAGVIPRLRERGDWLVLRMRPGDAPFRALAARLSSGETFSVASGSAVPEEPRSVDHPQDQTSDFQRLEAEERGLAGELLSKPHLLGLALRRLAARERKQVLLFVDQLEELVTMVDDARTRRRFMDALCGAADDAEDPVRIIFTLREDFLSRLSRGPLVRVAMGRVTVMHRPDNLALGQTLDRPVEAMGYRFEDDTLVSQMTSEVEGERAALPLLQFAARQLWERRDMERKLLTRAAHGEMGGVTGALAAHADGVLEEMSAEEQAEARELLLRMVTAEGTRQVVSRRRLLDGRGETADQVLDRLTAARLITTRKGTGTGGGMELVHESLVTSWRRLACWLEESREDLAFLEEATRAAELWRTRGRRAAEVWTGQALLEAEGSLARCSASAPALVLEFIEAGQRRRRGRNNRVRVLAILLVAVLTLLAVVFYRQKEDAEEQRNQARAGRQVARQRLARSLRQGARAALARGRRLEARAQLRSSLEVSDSVTARALWWKLRRDPQVWTARLGASVGGAVFSPDGKRLAAACLDDSVYLIDRHTRTATVLRGFSDKATGVAFHPQGKLLAVGTRSGHLHLRDLDKGTERIFHDHSEHLWHIAFSPNGRWLASARRELVIRDLAGGAPRRLPGHKHKTTGLAFSPSSALIGTTSSGAELRIRRLADGETVHELTGPAKGFYGLDISPDGARVAAGTWDGRVMVWDLAAGARPAVLRGHRDRISSVKFSRRGVLASTSFDGTVRLWDPAGQPVRVLRGHTGWAIGGAFDAGGRHLVSSGYDRTVRLWDTSVPPPPGPSGGHRRGIPSVAVLPGGGGIVSAGYDRTVRVWDVKLGEPRLTLSGYPGRIAYALPTPDGEVLAVGGKASFIRLYKLPAGERLADLNMPGADVNAMAMHPRGELLAASSSRWIKLWDLKTRVMAQQVETASYPHALAFSPDGRHLASGYASGRIDLWSWPGGKLRRTLSGHTDVIDELVFAPGSDRLVSFSEDNTVRVWPVAGGPPRVIGPLPGRAYMGDISPDGETIGVALSDGTARLFDADGRPGKILRGHTGEANAFKFVPGKSSQLAVSVGDDATIRLWELASGGSRWTTRLMTATPPAILTHRGWRSMGAAGPPPVKSAWARAAAEGDRVGAASSQGAHLCLLDRAGELHLWDLKLDRRAWSAEVSGTTVVATDEGCLVSGNGDALLFDAQGSYKRLSSKALAVSWQRGRALVVDGAHLQIFDQQGRRTGQHDVDANVTAAMLLDPWLVLGFREGNIELHPRAGGKARPGPAFEEVPSSAVVTLQEGPAGTLLAGFANGMVGIWNRETGALLHSERLHGPARQLRLHGRKLHAASELGDHVSLDMATFYSPYAKLLEEVQARVPVIWRGGRVQAAQP